MHHWFELPVVKGTAIVLAVAGGLGTLGDGLNGFQTIRSLWPFVTHREIALLVTRDQMDSELEARKAKRDEQFTLAQADTNRQLRDLNNKVDDIDLRSLRWRVEDYPSKISNAQSNLVTLQAALADPNLSAQLRINLGTQILETQSQIAALQKAQAADTCLLYHSC